MSVLAKLKQIIHWGPLIALTIIFTITSSTVHITLQWWPVSTLGGKINMAVFLTWNIITLYNFFRAAFVGPGFVPYGWKPENVEDTKYLQYCHFCEGYKAPRSHHCRKCNRCVMKMDHHCPWINTCCGHFNHGNFANFLFFACCGCFHSSCSLIPGIIRAVNMPYYVHRGVLDVPIVYLGIKGFIHCVFSIGLSIGVIVAVGALWYFQIKSILRNETGIEQWIRDKAYYRPREEDETEEFIYPYDLGRWRNFTQVYNLSGNPVSDGITWDVIEDCDQYTFTIEQLKQKADKIDRAVEYKTVEDYSGSVCPISKGLRVCCRPPCTDEKRIAIKKGDMVLVTRWKKYWLYGDKLEGPNKTLVRGRDRKRGWFPRRCAVEIVDNGVCQHQGDTKKTD
ncbi:unnamed protein product [Owenia fusiformis]|uniref:Palmitoyltransferase n=1 Tax=Owenia fusiformis TaxID=6347 RepID=A0A8J1U6Z2_OWEFU|nr:unnamed protein product [Owenia fusiformis]